MLAGELTPEAACRELGISKAAHLKAWLKDVEALEKEDPFALRRKGGGRKPMVGGRGGRAVMGGWTGGRAGGCARGWVYG